MSDSNEIKKPTTDAHPRLRLPLAGLKAQKEQDAGETLTTESYANLMNDLMLDILNDRIERNKAMTAIAAGNQIVQAARLELQNREMFYRYQYKNEQSVESSEPLRLAGKPKKELGTRKKAAS